MKLWIDDLRAPPDETWEWVKTSADALLVLKHFASAITEVSFDHDLGGDDTVMPFVLAVEARAFHGKGDPFAWHVHSANPVGRQNIVAAMDRVEKFWSANV